jgi:hypothetical protein
VLKTKKKYKCTLPSVEWLTLGKVGFAECPRVALGKEVESSLCREPLDGTRQRRRLCRVPPIWHSANHNLKIKKSLPSAASRALGKEHKLSQSDGFSFFSLSLTLTHCTRSRPRPPSPPTPRPGPPSPPATRRPRPCARSPRARAPPTTADDPAPTTYTPSTAHDLHAVTPVRRRAPSTPSK